MKLVEERPYLILKDLQPESHPTATVPHHGLSHHRSPGAVLTK
jgi:hypothetical protein